MENETIKEEVKIENNDLVLNENANVKEQELNSNISPKKAKKKAKKIQKKRIKSEYKKLSRKDQKYESLIHYFFRILMIAMRYNRMRKGAKKLRKWENKAIKLQDPNLHTFEEKWEFLSKRLKTIIKFWNIDLKLIGKNNLFSGNQVIVANHLSNIDAMLLIQIYGPTRFFSPIAKKELEITKWAPYLKAMDAFFIDRANLRNAVPMLDLAGQFVKNNNRGLLIFPEGTRSKDCIGKECKIGEFSTSPAAIAKKYYMPIQPISIRGTKWAEEHLMDRSHKKVEIIIHTPLKQANLGKLDSIHITNQLYKIVSDGAQPGLLEGLKIRKATKKGNLPKFSNKHSRKK